MVQHYAENFLYHFISRMITKIIHISSATERDFLVERIVKLTGAEIFEGIVVKGNGQDGRDGCRLSHEEIYKGIPKGEDLLIFEDDCVINDESFLDFIKENKDNYDIIYIGVNSVLLDKNNMPYKSSGTHSMWLSYNAIRIYLKYHRNHKEVDHIWCEIEKLYNLKVLRANPITKYTVQHEGFVSYITGTLRGKIWPKTW